MKKFYLLLFYVLLVSSIKAQLTIGPKLGVNFSKENYGNPIYTTAYHSYFYAGAFSSLGLSKHSAVGLELFYSGEGTHESYQSGGSTITGVVTEGRINVPLLYTYKFPLGIYAQTGPQFGFLLSAKGVYTDGTYDFKANTQPITLSWVIDAGYSLNALLPGLKAEARFAPTFTPISKGSVNAVSIKGSVISVGLSYDLFTTKKLSHKK